MNGDEADSQLLMLLADWLKSDARLAPLYVLLYLVPAPLDLEAHLLFLSVLLCCPRIKGAESRKDWVQGNDLTPSFGLLTSLEVVALWSCSLLIFSRNWCGNKGLSVGIPSRKVRFPDLSRIQRSGAYARYSAGHLH